MKSSSEGTPAATEAAPQSTGKNLPDFMPLVRPLRISSGASLPSAKNFSMSASSPSAALSMSERRAASASALIASGTGASLPSMYAFISMRSTMPLKSAAAPMGMTTGTKVALNLSVRSATTVSKSARSLSILLMKMKRGMPDFVRRRHSLIVSICTPTSAPTSRAAQSATRNAATTSPTKSAEPGVSRMLILQSFHMTWLREVCTEILWAISSSVKSLTVFPVSTFSALGITPPATSNSSTRVVLPVPPWPAKATFRSERVGTLILGSFAVRG